MLYRPCQPGDFEQLYAVEEICFQPPFRFSRSWMRQIIAAPDSATWLADESGELAGFAIVDWQAKRSGVRAYIQTIEVVPAHRRSGVAAELLRRLEGSAIDAGSRLIWLHVDAENEAAIQLYKKHGYEFKSREENYYPRGRAALIYAKPLAQTASIDPPSGS